MTTHALHILPRVDRSKLPARYSFLAVRANSSRCQSHRRPGQHRRNHGHQRYLEQIHHLGRHVQGRCVVFSSFVSSSFRRDKLKMEIQNFFSKLQKLLQSLILLSTISSVYGPMEAMLSIVVTRIQPEQMKNYFELDYKSIVGFCF